MDLGKWTAIALIGIAFAVAFGACYGGCDSMKRVRIEAEKTKQLQLQLEIEKLRKESE